MIHKYLKTLVEQGKLEKVGQGAHTKYQLTSAQKKRSPQIKTIGDKHEVMLPYEQQILLDTIFLKFDATGKQLEGAQGFVARCQESGFDPKEKAKAYIAIDRHIQEELDSCGLIEATAQFKKHVEKMYLDKVYYADQYKRMEFGRGKLAEMTFYGKQSQNYELLMDSISIIKRKLNCYVHREQFDALAIVPWSIKRDNQLLRILKQELASFNLPFISIIKYYPHKIPIPQKTLKTREQRLRNAKETIFVDDQHIAQYKKVLLIDDFVGSGSTLNETAGKLKAEGVVKVEGFAFVGNTDLTYEVI